jgi:hypothetical protein
MPNRIDITGQTFGRLTALYPCGTTKTKQTLWWCQCSCGNQVAVRGSYLRTGNTKSCGCLAREQSRERNYETRQDLTGLRVGQSTVISFSHTTRGRGESGGRPHWNVRCDCGKVRVMQAGKIRHALRYGLDLHCIDCENLSRRSKNWLAKQVMRRYINNAHTRSIPFELTLETIAQLIQKPCYYCGCPPSNTERHKGKRDTGLTGSYSGIDRLDPTQGYTEANCVPCCWTCNRLKNSMTAEAYIGHCLSVAALHSHTPL